VRQNSCNDRESVLSCQACAKFENLVKILVGTAQVVESKGLPNT